jgi:hypothetical protein
MCRDRRFQVKYLPFAFCALAQLNYERDTYVKKIVQEFVHTHLIRNADGPSIFLRCLFDANRDSHDIAQLRNYIVRHYSAKLVLSTAQLGAPGKTLGSANNVASKWLQAFGTLVYNLIGSAHYRNDATALLPLLCVLLRYRPSCKTAVYELTYRLLRDTCHVAQTEQLFQRSAPPTEAAVDFGHFARLVLIEVTMVDLVAYTRGRIALEIQQLIATQLLIRDRYMLASTSSNATTARYSSVCCRVVVCTMFAINSSQTRFSGLLEPVPPPPPPPVNKRPT